MNPTGKNVGTRTIGLKMSDVSAVNIFLNSKVKLIEKSRIEGKKIINKKLKEIEKQFNDLEKFLNKHKSYLEKICPSFSNTFYYKNPTGNRYYENFLGSVFDYLSLEYQRYLSDLKHYANSIPSIYVETFNVDGLGTVLYPEITPLQAYSVFSIEKETGPLSLSMISEALNLNKKRVSESIKELIDKELWEKRKRIHSSGTIYVKKF